MKPNFFIAITILALSAVDGELYRSDEEEQKGLDFNASVRQAKNQIKYFFAREKPVHESIDKLEDYYVDVKEKHMRKLHPRRKLIRPCKVLPDPQPGLVNPKLVAPVHLYKPLRSDEKFYGKFAPPVSYEMTPQEKIKAKNEMVVGSLPPVHRSYPGVGPVGSYPPVGPYHPAVGPHPIIDPYHPAVGPVDPYNPVAGPVGPYPPAAGPVPNPYAYPVIQKQTVYAPNPFYGYSGDYKADNDYFQKVKENEIIEADDPYYRGLKRHLKRKYRGDYSILPTMTATPTSWKEYLKSDYSIRISSMSEELASNSAAIISMSLSAKLASMSSRFAKKEASLRARLSSATMTATRTKDDWHW